ncbi:sugar kinase [Paenirhodobacter populi]|uniref:Sugar kinase n=1 Tax=Paenirhodobacter populi TaxID=2306993 RepID=A0A443JFN6_9RHOB|nr:sugar kinase [Sinirhodobacter populi]RWR19300.1 sugar kinase [Sinirhodobacter populi]
MTPQTIVCLGEVMIELSPAGPGLARIGVAGDTFNTAVYLRRLTDPAVRVSYVTALGDDIQSDRILAALREEGLDTSRIARVPDVMPGLYMITLDADNERSFSYWRGASAARTMFGPGSALGPEDLAPCDLLYLSGISIAILAPDARRRLRDWIAGFRARGGRVAFDSNYRPRLWSGPDDARAEIRALWELTDIALPSLDDEIALFGDAGEAGVMARLAAWGVRDGALKRGARGPRALDGSGREIAPGPVGVIDTTAAGDSFNAGFLAGVTRGANITGCMETGHATAARVIGHPGAIVPRAIW